MYFFSRYLKLKKVEIKKLYIFYVMEFPLFIKEI